MIKSNETEEEIGEHISLFEGITAPNATEDSKESKFIHIRYVGPTSCTLDCVWTVTIISYQHKSVEGMVFWGYGIPLGTEYPSGWRGPGAYTFI